MIELSEIKENVTWQKAMDYAGELGEEWELPELWELALMHKAKTLGHPLFQDMTGSFFSSSTYVGNTNGAWYVNFYNGYVGHLNEMGSLNARCMRVRPGDLENLVTWVREKSKVKQ
jgi:hypothetical protein